MKNYLGMNIDGLVDEYARLVIVRQNIDDKVNDSNTKIERTIRNLENKAFVLKEKAKRQIAEIDRTLGKIRRQIENEKIYVNSLHVGKERELSVPSFAQKDYVGGNR